MPVDIIEIAEAECQAEGCTNKVLYELMTTDWCSGYVDYHYLCLHHTITYMDDEARYQIKKLEKMTEPALMTNKRLEQLEYLNNFINLAYELKLGAVMSKEKHLAGE